MKTEKDTITLCPECYAKNVRTPLTITKREAGRGYGYCVVHGKVWVKKVKV